MASEEGGATCPLAHVHLSTRKSMLFNRFSKGLWPRTGCVIMLLHHSEKACREEDAPGRVRPGRGCSRAEGRSALHRLWAVIGANNLVIILEVKFRPHDNECDND